ncbi:MAG: outer membrane beta-barrel protein [Hoylesella buccalis]
MKRLFVAFICIVACCMSTNAKIKTDFGTYALGASGLYGTSGDYNHGGAGLTLQKFFGDEFRFSMFANYFFKQNNASFIEFGTDFNYVFPLTPKLGIYPVLGLGYSIMKLNNVIEKPAGVDILPDDYTDDSEGNLNFDLGAGCEYYFTPSFKGFAEAKYRYVKNYDRTLFQVGVAYVWQTTN